MGGGRRRAGSCAADRAVDYVARLAVAQLVAVQANHVQPQVCHAHARAQRVCRHQFAPFHLVPHAQRLQTAAQHATVLVHCGTPPLSRGRHLAACCRLAAAGQRHGWHVRGRVVVPLCALRCPVWCWAARPRPGRGRLPPRGRRQLVPAACARTRVSTRAAAGLCGAAESTLGFSAHSHTEAQSAAAPMRGRTRQLRARTSASACRLASPGSVPAGAAGSWKLVRCLLVSPSVFHSATGLGSCAQRQARPQNAAGGSAPRRMRRAVRTR